MPKRSQKQIDQDEKDILFELKKNADASLDMLAKKLKFSRQKIWRIKKRLDKNKIVWGYTAIVDLEKNDLKHYTMLIKRTAEPIDDKTLNLLTTTQLNEAAAKIGANIETSAYTHGEYDWMITFTAPEISQAKKFSEIVYKQLKNYVASTTLMETLFFVKNHHIQNPKMEKLKEFI